MYNREQKLRKHRRDRSDCMSIVEANNVSAAYNQMVQAKSTKKAVSQERTGDSRGQHPARPHSRSYQQMSKHNLQSKSRSPSSSIQEDSSSEKLSDSNSISEEASSGGQCQCKCGGCPCYNRGRSRGNSTHSQENSVTKFSRDSGDEWQVESERKTTASMPNLELGNSKPLPDYETLGNNASVDRDSISSDSDAARQTRSMMNLRHLQIDRSYDADHENREKKVYRVVVTDSKQEQPGFETLTDLVQYYNAFMDAKNKSSHGEQGKNLVQNARAPPWPATITTSPANCKDASNAKYAVMFFGTRETAQIKATELFDYKEYRHSFEVNRKIKGFNEAVQEIRAAAGIQETIQEEASEECSSSHSAEVLPPIPRSRKPSTRLSVSDFVLPRSRRSSVRLSVSQAEQLLQKKSPLSNPSMLSASNNTRKKLRTDSTCSNGMNKRTKRVSYSDSKFGLDLLDYDPVLLSSESDPLVAMNACLASNSLSCLTTNTLMMSAYDPEEGLDPECSKTLCYLQANLLVETAPGLFPQEAGPD
uniref:PWWP domain-containing protein n=1 Tax=Ditylenchus dipsaci TaxID=166011 RepID=A0A915END2_9BILA